MAGLVIIVFTDIVNSTAIKSLLPGGDIRAATRVGEWNHPSGCACRRRSAMLNSTQP